MPRAPISSRRGFFTFINRNINPPVTRQLDCNVVETELGTMVEPRNFGYTGTDSKIVNGDPMDEGFNSETLMDEGAFANQYNTYVTQRPFDFNY